MPLAPPRPEGGQGRADAQCISLGQWKPLGKIMSLGWKSKPQWAGSQSVKSRGGPSSLERDEEAKK